MTDLVHHAAERIAKHLRILNGRYPAALPGLESFSRRRGQDGLPDWPEWCWVPMAAAASIVSNASMRNPADIGRVAAVAQWALHTPTIVLPRQEVAERAVPGKAEDIESMDIAIPRDHLLEVLGSSCHYLIQPLDRPHDHAGDWLHGVYVHLEHDSHSGRTEVRFVLDFGSGWNGLIPSFVHADQPTLAWSARDIAATAAPSPVPGEVTADFARVHTWMAWPLLGALLDDDARLVGPTPVPGTTLPAEVPAERWELTYGAPRMRPV
ncbi:hypothetical protein [Sphaerisporangium aureirubrum]|uniref:Uncharacterized protein n=1 Tax=Sphaerisporangium aureirubrum TaxID=1544736 RepID=A0ABW1NDM3_9ACTN